MFRVNGTSLKFCLVGLSDVESAEITRLITENGGEIWDSEVSSEIIFQAICDKQIENRTFLHTDYIRECIEHGQFLYPSNANSADFKTMNKENEMFTLIDNEDRMRVEHSYARGEYLKEGTTNTNTCFEEQEFCHAEQRHSTINSHEKSPTAAIAEVTIIRRWVNSSTSNELTEKKTSLDSTINGIYPPTAAPKDADKSPLQGFTEAEQSIEELEHTPMQERLQKAQASETVTLNGQIAPTISSVKLIRVAGKRVEDHQPVVDSSRNAQSSTIIQEESSRVKTSDGGIRESLCKIEEICIDLTDSDDLDCNRTTAISIPESRKSVEDSSLRLQKAHGREETSKRDRATPASSTEDDLSGPRSSELTKKQTLVNPTVNKMYPPIAAQKENEKSLQQAFTEAERSFKELENTPMQERRQKAQASETVTLNGQVAPTISSVKLIKVAGKSVEDHQPVIDSSRNAQNSTIIHEKSSRVKTSDGGFRESLRKIEEFRLESSDSDDTDCNRTIASSIPESRKSAESSSLRLQNAHSKGESSTKHTRTLDSSTEDVLFEGEGEIDVTDHDKRTRGLSNSTKVSKKNSRTLLKQKNLPRTSDDRRNNMVSSNTPSEDVESTSKKYSSDASEDEFPSSRSKRTSNRMDYTKERQANQNIREPRRPPTSNTGQSVP